jgi:hypothetical protein
MIIELYSKDKLTVDDDNKYIYHHKLRDNLKVNDDNINECFIDLEEAFEDTYCECDDICMSNKYIKCPKCDIRTSYCFSYDVDRTVYNFYCFKCEGILAIHNCMSKFDYNKCSLMELKQKDLVDYEYNEYNEYNNNNNLVKDIYKTDVINNIVIEGGEEYNNYSIKFNDNTYLYYENILEYYTGSDGGVGPECYCNYCDKYVYISDK